MSTAPAALSLIYLRPRALRREQSNSPHVPSAVYDPQLAHAAPDADNSISLSGLGRQRTEALPVSSMILGLVKPAATTGLSIGVGMRSRDGPGGHFIATEHQACGPAPAARDLFEPCVHPDCVNRPET